MLCNTCYKQAPGSNILIISQSSYFLGLFGLEKTVTVTLLIHQSQTNKVFSDDAKKVVRRLRYYPHVITRLVLILANTSYCLMSLRL